MSAPRPIVAIWLALAAGLAAAQDRDTKVRNDKSAFADNDSWIYNDMKSGFREAKKSGKPLLVVIRCIP